MKVSDVLFETLRSKNKLSDASRQIFNAYYPHLQCNSQYWLGNIETAYFYIYEFLGAVRGPRILDVGCGVGTESIAFASQGATVLGIDVTPAYLSCAQERLRLMAHLDLNVQFSCKNLLDYTDCGEFDAVWLNQAYHHLEPRRRIIIKLANLVKKGGYIFISETNAMNPFVQLMLFRQRGFQTIREYEESDGTKREYGRERVTTARRIINAFGRHGFHSAGVKHYKVLPNSEKYARFEKFVDQLSLPRLFYANYTLSLVKL